MYPLRVAKLSNDQSLL